MLRLTITSINTININSYKLLADNIVNQKEGAHSFTHILSWNLQGGLPKTVIYKQEKKAVIW